MDNLFTLWLFRETLLADWPDESFVGLQADRGKP